jgi:RNA polymerase sigma-70 factor (ECF subfamily)
MCATGVGALEQTAGQQTAASDPDWPDIHACLDGDEAAFGRLIDRHQRRIAAQMSRLCRDPMVCEELVQDVFVKAYFSLSGYRGEGAFSHWLSRIASRVACDYCRRASHRPTPLPLEEWDQLKREPQSVDATKASAMLQTLLAQLGPEDRLVLTMIYFEECSTEEIAERTGWNPGAVRMRASRAREKLREIVAKAKLSEDWTWNL